LRAFKIGRILKLIQIFFAPFLCNVGSKYHGHNGVPALKGEPRMNLHMTGHHLEITPAMRDYVATKMTRINRHFDHVIDVNMILTVEKLRQRIEANVHLSGKDIFVESADADMYAAIDLLVDKLDRQIVKHKEKIKSRHFGQAPKRVPLVDSAAA
jgi:putative sigma-54 modulation protein